MMEGESEPAVSSVVLGPEHLADAIRQANLEPLQLSSASLESRVGRVICPNMCVDIANIGPAMLFSGAMSASCFTIVLVTECPTPGRSFNFGVEHEEGYIGFFPPGGQLDAYTPEGYANMSLTVPEEVFLDALESSFPEMPGGLIKHGAGVRIGGVERSELEMIFRAIRQALEDSSNSLADPRARAELEKLLLDAFLTGLRSAEEIDVPRPGTRMHGRMKNLKQARDFVRDHVHEAFGLDELCQGIGMSKRGVEVLFRASLGITPHAFVRNQRLHGVRRALLESSPGAGSVKESALEWGFWHMGHFSANYRQLFGETPSMTLSR